MTKDPDSIFVVVTGHFPRGWIRFRQPSDLNLLLDIPSIRYLPILLNQSIQVNILGVWVNQRRACYPRHQQ